MPPEDRRAFVLGVLPAFHTLWAFVAFACAEHPAGTGNVLGALMLVSGAAAQATLLATVYAFGDWNGYDRWGAFVVGGPSFAIAYAFGLAWNAGDADLAGLMAVLMGLALGAATWCPFGLGALVARRWGWRWRDDRDPPGAPLRFSLASLLGLTTLCAVALAAWRWMMGDATGGFGEPRPEWLHVGEATLALGVSAATIAAGRLELGPRWAALAAIVTLAFAAGAAAPCVLQPDRSAGFAMFWGAALATYAALVAGSLELLRFAGLRVDREPAATDDATRQTADDEGAGVAR